MWLAPRIVKINQIKSVGLYDFLGLRECILKPLNSSLVLSSSRQPEAMSRAAIVGRFHHKVFEYAATVDTRVELKNLIEAEIKKLQLEVDSWPHLRRSGAVSGWDEVNRSASAATKFHRESSAVSNKNFQIVETTYSTKDGTMVGRPDYFIVRPNGALIREYKSSSLRTESGEVRPEYEIQGRFYAALILDNFPVPKVDVSIESLDGERIEYTVLPAAADKIRAEVNIEISKANARIGSVENFDDLVSPTAKSCQYCKNRILCPVFSKIQLSLQLNGPMYLLDGVLQDSATRLNDKMSTVRLREFGSNEVRELNVPHSEVNEMTINSRYVIENLNYVGAKFQWTELSRVYQHG